MPNGALAGLKILDLTHYIAGPYCTKLLAGMGAEVIKVERPGKGDPLRRVGPFYRDQPGENHSCPFLYLNTDKQSLTLNLKSSTGLSICRQLVEWADVLVESFRPGVMARLGLTYEEIENINPRTVMISLSNFGQTGPYRDYAMTDITAQALGGVMNEMGEPDGVPVKLGGYQALYAAGVAAFTAVMTGVLARAIHGFGQYLDVSIMEMMAYTEWHASAYYAYTGQHRRRPGRYSMWKILPARDGHMGVVGQWPQLQGFLGELVDDERFATPEGRLEHTLEIGRRIESELVKHDKMELYHRGQAAGVPWGFVANMDDLLQSPQYAERGFLKTLDHPDVGRGTYAGQPFQIGDQRSGPWRPAPRLGEHTDKILGELLGYGPNDLARLREKQVV